MGKKIKTKSNESLAAPHAAGAAVNVLQSSLHRVYGMINLHLPHYWIFYYEEAHSTLERLRVLDKRILAVPVHPSQSRVINDPTFIKEIFLTGTRLVTDVNLAFEYLAPEIENTVKPTSLNDDLNERLIHLARAIDFKDIPNSVLYERFSELRTVRHSIMHPKPDNTHNLLDWAKVPLAWVVSDKCIDVGQDCIKLLRSFAQHWENVKQGFDRPATLTAERGIQSLHSVKHAPKKEDSRAGKT